LGFGIFISEVLWGSISVKTFDFYFGQRNLKEINE
jgi:hypothetical protein